MKLRLVLPLTAALTLLLTAALTFPACGGADSGTLTSEGYAALNSGQPSDALAKFDQALAKLEPGAPRYLEAKIGQLRSQAYSAPAAAVAGFLALSQSQPVASDVYRSLVVDLTSAKAYGEATEILTAGKEAHPEYSKWQELINSVGDRAKEAGDSDALKALEGLGYVGGD